MFSFHSSNAIPQAVNTEGKVLTLRIALMGLCTRGGVFGVYLVINGRHANVPFMSVIPLVTANAGPLTFITEETEGFLGRCRAIFCESGPDSRHTHVWARRSVFCTCQQRWNVRGGFHNFCRSSFVAAIVPLLARGSWQPNKCRQHTAPLPCRHHCDVGESHSWICDCRCDASGRVAILAQDFRSVCALCTHHKLKK